MKKRKTVLIKLSNCLRGKLQNVGHLWIRKLQKSIMFNFAETEYDFDPMKLDLSLDFGSICDYFEEA